MKKQFEEGLMKAYVQNYELILEIINKADGD